MVIVFKLKEKPVIKEIEIEGAKRVHRKRIAKFIDVKEGEFLDEYKLKEIQNSIEDFYHKKGFSAARVSYKIDVDKDNQASVTFVMDERRIIRVKKIIVKGSSAFSPHKIKKLIRTKERGFFRKGVFKKETLDDDIKRIEDFYKEKGFSEIKADYTLDYLKEDIYITINLDESLRYYIGRIKIEGNQDLLTEDIESVIEIKVGDVYVEKKANEGANKIKGLYIDAGYIFAQIRPIIFFNPQTQNIDITFNVIENEVAYVEKIDVKGNVKTRDKVIRRELRIYPGDKFEGTKIRKSRERLENLGFFEEVRFDSHPGSKPNWENLIVDVKEAKTGYLSFGGGYSSIDEFTGFIELRQRNFDYKNWSTFTGAGQDLSIMASFGTVTERYGISFLNPWIFDKPISFGFEAYKKGHKREEDVGYGYEETIKGGAFRFGKEFNDNLKGYIGYRFDRVEIGDIAEDATQALMDEEGTNDLSSIELELSYDTRDNVFVPSRGLLLSNGISYTGLGGDKDFIKYTSSTSLFFSLLKKSVLEFRIRFGLAEPFSDTETTPIYKRFFVGGASTVRGYDERSLGPIDPVTEDPIGGESFFVGNIEYTYPVIDVLKAAVFFDTGSAWAKSSDFLSEKVYSSIGLGIRVKTPLGPIKLDYGWPLDTAPGEDESTGKFHFSISRGF